MTLACSNGTSHPTDARDAPASDLNNDKATDKPSNEDGTGAAGTSPDGMSPDTNGAAGSDAAAGHDGGVDAADAAQPQKLVSTVLVIDSVPDGGVDGSTDAGVDGSMPTVDPNLVNPWGLAFNPSGPIWIANNGTGTSTVYNAQGVAQPLIVTIPPPTGGTPPSAPTGLVFNVTTAFMGDKFIFSSEDGTIAGWQTGTAATTRVENATAHSVYKGLALGLRNSVARLYATDFHNGKVDVYDMSYNKITTTGGFVDPTIPTGFAPFGVHAEGATVFVTYAKQDADAKDDVKGAGNGYVDAFDFDGVLTKRLVSQGALNSPWAIALAPSDFGNLSHDLIIGNFGDGKVNAYDPSTGAFQATAITSGNVPLVIPGLWSLVFGNDTAGAAHNQLFFTAGPNDEMNGVFGRLDFVP
ncbi:MAG TPA: TIGR03118 family protein [Polyangia bacterium]|nr:TIGR03118 family protein [Polyangia bacterium]